MRSTRCVVYATPDHDAKAFARAVARADGQWQPVVVPPPLIDAAVEALQPEVVVVATQQPRAVSLLRRTRKRYGRRLLFVDDRHLTVLTKLLALAA